MMLKVQLKPIPTADVEQPVGVLAGLITTEEAAAQNAEQKKAQGMPVDAQDKLTEQVPVPKAGNAFSVWL
jgi:hypothetical protein